MSDALQLTQQKVIDEIDAHFAFLRNLLLAMATSKEMPAVDSMLAVQRIRKHQLPITLFDIFPDEILLPFWNRMWNVSWKYFHHWMDKWEGDHLIHISTSHKIIQYSLSAIWDDANGYIQKKPTSSQTREKNTTHVILAEVQAALHSGCPILRCTHALWITVLQMIHMFTRQDVGAVQKQFFHDVFCQDMIDAHNCCAILRCIRDSLRAFLETSPSL